ncbi:hypothetical protein Rmag_0130 [Candidatus Ruthia magnifica str. Cm (Calyptogena magnifica)]|uniref:Uncharacterized protein n=2 Tax=Candidatus Ruthturnera TaxID=1541743 RepID=A1AVG8_RUTMC|nr:hypothetical protein Rmag_0130 [Candidatus Ruthia magnifica str. Cm (Calyptogena magnifica)]
MGYLLILSRKLEKKMSKPIIENNYSLTNFEYAVYRCELVSKSQTHLVAFKNGCSEITSELDMEVASIFANLDSYININLNNILSKFLSDKTKSFVLADDELKLLAVLRLENNSEITAKMDEYGKRKDC